MKQENISPNEKRNLRGRPFGLAWFIVALVVATLVFSYLSFFKPSLDGVNQTINQLHLQTAFNTKEKIDNFMNSNLIDLEDLSATVGMIENPDDAKKEIERFVKKRNWFYEISLIDSKGQENLKYSQFATFDQKMLADYSMADFFMQAQQGKTYVSDVQTTEEAMPFVTISLPLSGSKDQMGSANGALLAKLSFQEIESIVTSTKVGKTGQSYLVDSKGIVIAHSNNSFVLKKQSFANRNVVQEALGLGNETGSKSTGGMGMGMGGPEPPADLALTPNTGSTCAEYINENNVMVYAVGVLNLTPRSVLVVEEPRDEVLAPYYRIRSAAITLNFLAALLLFLIIFNTRRLSNLFSILKQRENQLGQEALRREKELIELDRTTKLLVRRDMELSEANRRLEQLDVVKSDFVSIAAHQLRTPLTGVKWSFLALLEQDTGSLNPDQKKIIEDGLSAINHTITLINDLLNVAHIEEGRFGFNFKMENLEGVLQESFQRFQSLAGEKGIWLSLDLPKQKLPAMTLDKEKIALVLDNLLDNAIKYTSPGGKVRMSCVLENEIVKIAVSDTGIGIPSAQLERVFTKFFRAENALLFQTSGTGLGLYMIKNIIERHCGTIEVKSEENKGTTFTVELPLACKL